MIVQGVSDINQTIGSAMAWRTLFYAPSCLQCTWRVTSRRDYADGETRCRRSGKMPTVIPPPDPEQCDTALKMRNPSPVRSVDSARGGP